jgi:class 3 adenylate cyclase
MSLFERVNNRVRAIVLQPWITRRSNGAPETANVQLAGGGVEVSPTMLYADLADSTVLATYADPKVAATVIKAFLSPVVDIIRHYGGHIRSFDGDRVMGVFVGPGQNDRAVRVALQINQAVHYVIRPAVESAFPQLRAAGFVLKHGVGIDHSPVLAVRAGVRDNNDLTWIGRAPNVAAKLSGERDARYPTLITDIVYQSLATPQRMSSDGLVHMWTPVRWDGAPVPEVAIVHGSGWGIPLPQNNGVLQIR